MTVWRWSCVAALLAAGCGSSTKSAHDDMGQDASVDTDMAKEAADAAINGDAAVNVDSGADAATAKDAAPVFVDGGVTGTFVYVGANPGSGSADDYVITVNHDSNSATVSNLNATTPFTLEGTFVTLASGFLKLTIDQGCNGNSCGPHATTTVNAPGGGTVTIPFVAHVLEAPGYLILVQPDDGNGDSIAAAGQSGCVTALLATYNAIPVAPQSNYNVETQAAYQQIALSGTAASPAPDVTDYTINASPSPEPSPGPGSCNQGIITFGGGASAGGASVYQSGIKGVLFVSNPNNNNIATVGLVQSAVTLADLENHTYSGFYFAHSGSGSSGYVTLPYASGNPAGIGREYTTTSDVDSNSPNPDDSKSTTITFTGVTNGIVSGTLAGSTTGKFKAAALKAGNVNILVLIAEQGGDGTNILNLILVSH